MEVCKMNQYKYNGWTIQWEGDHEDYCKENKFILMEKDLEQIMVKMKFKGDIVRIKTSIAEGVEIDADNKIITVINIPDPYADDNHQD
jgi:hypothetical protein